MCQNFFLSSKYLHKSIFFRKTNTWLDPDQEVFIEWLELTLKVMLISQNILSTSNIHKIIFGVFKYICEQKIWTKMAISTNMNSRSMLKYGQQFLQDMGEEPTSSQAWQFCIILSAAWHRYKICKQKISIPEGERKG